MEHNPLAARTESGPPDVAVAQALTLFEHAVRRHAVALAELRVARRASTTKAALKTAEAVSQARHVLTVQLQRLGWNPPADISLSEPTMSVPRSGD